MTINPLKWIRGLLLKRYIIIDGQCYIRPKGWVTVDESLDKTFANLRDLPSIFIGVEFKEDLNK